MARKSENKRYSSLNESINPQLPNMNDYIDPRLPQRKNDNPVVEALGKSHYTFEEYLEQFKDLYCYTFEIKKDWIPWKKWQEIVKTAAEEHSKYRYVNFTRRKFYDEISNINQEYKSKIDFNNPIYMLSDWEFNQKSQNEKIDLWSDYNKSPRFITIDINKLDANIILPLTKLKEIDKNMYFIFSEEYSTSKLTCIKVTKDNLSKILEYTGSFEYTEILNKEKHTNYSKFHSWAEFEYFNKDFEACLLLSRRSKYYGINVKINDITDRNILKYLYLITPVNVMENSINDMFKIDMESINKKVNFKINEKIFPETEN